MRPQLSEVCLGSIASSARSGYVRFAPIATLLTPGHRPRPGVNPRCEHVHKPDFGARAEMPVPNGQTAWCRLVWSPCEAPRWLGLDHSVPIEPNGVQPRTSLWSSRSLFPGKSDFGGQRQNGNNVRGGTVRESRDQVDPAERANTGYLAAPPPEISAVR
jgi:hypothetical protein